MFILFHSYWLQRINYHPIKIANITTSYENRGWTTKKKELRVDRIRWEIIIYFGLTSTRNLQQVLRCLEPDACPQNRRSHCSAISGSTVSAPAPSLVQSSMQYMHEVHYTISHSISIAACWGEVIWRYLIFGDGN